MVRKQVYISPEQNRLLKRAAREFGVAESELIRRGVDEATSSVKGPRDPKAWQEELAFMKERLRIKAPQTGRQWTRDDLYEDV